MKNARGQARPKNERYEEFGGTSLSATLFAIVLVVATAYGALGHRHATATVAPPAGSRGHSGVGMR